MINILQIIVLTCLLVSVAIALLSVLKFSNIFVKLIAIEVLVNIFICGVGLWALHLNAPLLFDICISLSLMMFLSTVAYCQFLLKRKQQDA